MYVSGFLSKEGEAELTKVGGEEVAEWCGEKMEVRWWANVVYGEDGWGQRG